MAVGNCEGGGGSERASEIEDIERGADGLAKERIALGGRLGIGMLGGGAAGREERRRKSCQCPYSNSIQGFDQQKIFQIHNSTCLDHKLLSTIYWCIYGYIYISLISHPVPELQGGSPDSCKQGSA